MDTLFQCLSTAKMLLDYCGLIKEKKKLAQEIYTKAELILDSLKSYKIRQNKLHESSLKELKNILLVCHETLVKHAKCNMFGKFMNFIKIEDIIAELNKLFQKVHHCLYQLNLSVSLENLTIQQSIIVQLTSFENSLKELVEKIEKSNSDSDEFDKVKNYMKNEEAFEWWVSTFKGIYEVTKYQLKKSFKASFIDNLKRKGIIFQSLDISKGFENQELFGFESPPKITAHEFDRFYRKIWLNPKLRKAFLDNHPISLKALKTKYNEQKIVNLLEFSHATMNALDNLVSCTKIPNSRSKLVVEPETTSEKSFGESTSTIIEDSNISELAKSDPAADEIENYEGPFNQNGKKEGIGKCTYKNSDCYEGFFKQNMRYGYGQYSKSKGWKFEGLWILDRRHGHGKLTYPSGTVVEGEWGNDKLNGLCKIFKNGLIIFEGQMKHGYPDGICKCVLSDGSSFEGYVERNQPLKGILISLKSERYEGGFKNSKRYGKGKLIKANGFVYEGDFINDDMCGHGSIIYPSGAKYIGNIKDNIPNGQGTYIYPNGNKYEGEFLHEQKDGYGTLYFVNGDKYVGEWQKDNINGLGEWFFHDGHYYQGEFVNRLRQGKGIFKYANGDIYEGDFKNNEKHGKGKFTGHNGRIYTGDYINSKKHGNGKLILNEKSWYEGEFFNGELHGKGLFHYENGSKYEGEFFMGYKSGQGVLTSKYYQYEGEFFKDFKCGKGKLQLANATIEGDFSENIIKNAQAHYVTGEKYQGEYMCINSNYVFYGEGKQILSNGDVYIGKFENGLFLEGLWEKRGGQKVKYKRNR